MEDEIVNDVKGKQLTVKELITLLLKCPEDYLVWHEGCDCWGEADRVEIRKDCKEILIGRCN